MFLDSALARRLENAEALNASVCGESIAVAGGYACFAGIESPLTHAVGMGMSGPVSAPEFDQMEGFYRSRGSSATVEACPHADFSLFELLGDRGYAIVECSNVMAGPVVGSDDARVRPAGPEEQELWSRVMLEGFFGSSEPTTLAWAVAATIFGMPEGLPWLGFMDGAAVAACGFNVRGQTAMLFADATLERARGQGLHLALIRARLKHAAKLGCNLAMAATTPGSVSQRNYERAGFRVAYTKIGLRRNFTDLRP